MITHESKILTIVVTGGSGLVGEALQWAISIADHPYFGRKENERWIFLSSADGDLRCAF